MENTKAHYSNHHTNNGKIMTGLIFFQNISKIKRFWTGGVFFPNSEEFDIFYMWQPYILKIEKKTRKNYPKLHLYQRKSKTSIKNFASCRETTKTSPRDFPSFRIGCNSFRSSRYHSYAMIATIRTKDAYLSFSLSFHQFNTNQQHF